MNLVFVFLVLIGIVILWFLLVFAFVPFGKFLYRIWKGAIDQLNKYDNKKESKED